MRLAIGLLIGGIALVSSCGSTKEAVVEPIVSTIITGKAERINLSVNSTDSATCAIEYSYFTSSDLAYRDSINQKVADFAINVTQFGRNQEKKILSQAFFQAQLDSFVRINRYDMDETGDDGYNHLWELEAYVEIDDSRDKFAQLQLTAWSYTGGAHGNGFTSTYLINKSDAKTLKLEDLFSNIEAVTKIGEGYFRKLYELESDVDLDDAGFWFENNTFHLNNNFSISGDVIVFLYNSYEIAPYSGGQTEIEIPLEELKDYLKIKL